jgi:GMP synthase-like glutamine amidotransferase
MSRIITLEHFRADGPGQILHWVERRKHKLRRVFLDEGHLLPAVDEFDLLIVMGGPMNVYEHKEHPWLFEEKAFLREAIAAGKPILGICLGAQLLADVLGGVVTKNREKEVGWWPVKFSVCPGPLASFPSELMAFHWHNDTFTIPTGAVHVASSEACGNQAFIYGDRVVALQFHIEISQLESGDLVNACPADLQPSAYVQTTSRILNPPPEAAALGPALDSLLDSLVVIGAPTDRNVR